MLSPRQRWVTAVTAFAVVRRESQWLMLRHERLGVVSWELPGGHLEVGESLEEAAARETREETGIDIAVGSLLATCVHEWTERGQRKLICFFDAAALSTTSPKTPTDDPRLIDSQWKDPCSLDLTDVSPFLHVLIDQQARGWADAPLHYRMTHRRRSDGLYVPAPL